MTLSFVDQIYKRLKTEFGSPRTPLRYTYPHELAIAVILSAQCTDEQVNRVTPLLFQRFSKIEDFYQAPVQELEGLIYSTGFYKNKTRHIRKFCKILVETFNGTLPKTMRELVSMPGVGRKTANVILQEHYGIVEGIVVDTHVTRISHVLGLTKGKNAEKIEASLKTVIPHKYWREWSLLLIFLGRKYCKARQPLCKGCPLLDICPSLEAAKAFSHSHHDT